MNSQQMERVCRGKVHHRAIIRKQDGTSAEGYLQPWDEDFVYLTTLDGGSAGKVALADITNIEFPDE